MPIVCPRGPPPERQGSPASAMELNTCWLSGTGTPMRHMAGTVTQRSSNKLHWVVYDKCKLGLAHRWQAIPNSRTGKNAGSQSIWHGCVCVYLFGCATSGGR